MKFHDCRVPSTLFGLCLSLALTAAEARAHGGQFRGPPLAPTPGGPTGAGSPGARTGSFASLGGPTSWVSWWEYNKAPYLRLRDAVHDPRGVGGSDGQASKPASMAPTEEVRREEILPALRRLCDLTSNRDVQTACLVAMAKIGVDHPEFELLPILRARLTRGNQEIRETAALALGVTRRIDALDDLVALARDHPTGRRLVRSESVDDRTRAFATYGIGLIAQRSPHVEVQERLVEVCAGLLDVDDRDLRVAALQALSVANLQQDTPGHKRLRWKTLERLWEFFDKDLGRGNELVQAHAPIAVARIIGRGDAAEHRHARQQLRHALDRRQRRSASIQQSAILALGKIVPRPGSDADDLDDVAMLQELSKEAKDELSRYFALMALAEIGGDANREFLLRALRDGGKATVKPWAAVALGVLAFHARQAPGGSVDTTIGQVLTQTLRNNKNESFRGAVSVALGLVGYRDAEKDLTPLLAKRRLRQAIRGYVAIGLAMMDATTVIPTLRKIVDDSKHDPLLMMQASIALGRLGDKDALDLLTAVMQEGDTNVARLSGIATAFRYIGDKRAVDRLLELLGDRGLAKLSRAFVAAALGGVADRDRLPWNACFSIGCNYRARVGSLTDGYAGILDIL